MLCHVPVVHEIHKGNKRSGNSKPTTSPEVLNYTKVLILEVGIKTYYGSEP